MSYLPATPTPRKPHGVTGAAVGLIIGGAVNFVCAAIWMAAGLSVLHDEVKTQAFLGASDVFAYTVVMSPVVSVFLAPATMIGGVQLARGRTRRLVLVGAVLAVVPISSCCFLAGTPLGIWALVVLRRPEVRAWFARGPQPSTGYGHPPSPYMQDLYQPWR